ncbi:MAG: Bax inhibitor-1/YccA family protein [Propionibacteriales bacterium]|nr:Bax inhibitor-1/YccA family protein [Propionibacteriales bacterium]
MQSKNPVLSKPDAWVVPGGQPQAYGQPMPGAQTYPGQGFPPPADPYGTGYVPAPTTVGGRMTIEDVLTKSAVTLGTVAGMAALTYWAFSTGVLPMSLIMPIWIVAGLVAFGTVLLVSFRTKVNPAFVLLYAAIEGVFIGAVSRAYEYLYQGIVPAAVFSTLVAAAATLGAYKFFRIRVTSKFRKMVYIGTLAYAGLLLVNFVMSLFGAGFLFGHGNIALLLGISAIGIGLAVFNLILDFDYIEQGIAIGADQSESWKAAFGLTVTLVWLYIEMLRLLSYLRR